MKKILLAVLLLSSGMYAQAIFDGENFRLVPKINPDTYNFITVTWDTEDVTTTINTLGKVGTSYMEGSQDYITETTLKVSLNQHQKIFNTTKRKFWSFPYIFPFILQ